MKIERIDFDGYPYLAELLLCTLDNYCPILTELKVPKGLDNRSAIVRHFKANPLNFLTEISHVPFSAGLFGDVEHRLTMRNGEWYKDKANRYVYVRVTPTDEPSQIKDDRTYD